MDRKGIKFDPRSKIFALLLVNLLLLLSHSIYFEISLFLSSVVIVYLGGEDKNILKYVLTFSLMLAFNLFIFPHVNGSVLTLLAFITLAIRKFLPCFILGKWIINSTQVGEFIAAMWKMNLPLTAIIPLSVMFRYFPTIKEEWKSISMAMKIRGINFSFERMVVPLLISAINTSEELSAAALCRGLDNPVSHTSLYRVGFELQDIILLLYLFTFSIGAIILKRAGII